MRNRPKKSVVKIVKDYSQGLFGFVYAKVGNHEDAEDIMQEVWTQLSTAINTEEIEHISGWLYRVARNKITDKHRKMKPEELENFENENGELDFVREILITDDQNPENSYLKDIFWEALFAALEELPDKQRLVFIRNELEDITLKQIADETGENLKTIISRKGYAVKHLRKRLLNLYSEFFES